MTTKKFGQAMAFLSAWVVILGIGFGVMQKQSQKPVVQEQSSTMMKSAVPTVGNPSVSQDIKSKMYEDVGVGEQVNLCQGFSEELGISESYPVAEKYSHLAFLGQLFTASDCGVGRVKEVGGEERRNGMKIFFKAAPSTGALSALGSIGFICSESMTAESCTEWKNEKTIKIQDLLKLKPFADEIDVDDCIVCG